MIKRFFILLLAIIASVGMSWASVTWISDQYGNEKGYNAGTPFTKDGVTVTMSDNAFVSYWGDASLQCIEGSFSPTAGNYVFSNSLGENFVKIVIAAGYPSDWESFPKGDGWALSGDEYNGYILTWTGNASTVTLMDNELHSVHQSIEGDIVFYFESDSEEPAPAKLPGAFTINANGDKIVFSRGNLQAKTTDLGANWTWDFAPNQWSLIGDAAANNAINGNKTVSANGTVDLFGWSTAATYYGINKSWNNDDYAGDFVDWGALMGTEWRTLSRAEFRYIVFDRAQAFNKQGKATVNGVSGYIFLPDAWTLPSGLSFTPSPGDYTTNQYDGANWEAMESAGAVFLPAAGDRSGTDIYMYGYGWYWTSTSTVDDKAYYLYFYEKSRDFVEHNRYDAKSVRLVTEAPIPPYEAAIKLINAIGTVELTAECKAKIDTARAAFNALSDGDKAQVTNIATLTTAEAAFDNVMDIWLSGDCDAILWKDTTLTVRKHAGEGNGAMADYNYMSRAPWYNNHWYDPKPNDIVIKSITIEEGVTHLGDYAFAWMSEMKTVTIPSSVTTIPEDAFYWSKAVDDIYLTVADTANLTWALPYSADAQFKPSKATRCHVPADLLTAYQEKFGTLNMTFVGDLDPITPLTPEQQQALDAAKGLINAIPSPVVYTPACKDAIDAARAAYDALTPDMLKQLVSNYATLTAAEATYANLKDVAVVEAKIAAIPTPVELKLATRDSIESARAAFEALNAEQKALVPAADLQKLTDAEAALAALNPGGGMPADALNGKFTINEDGDQIAFAKGNLQATTTDLGETWTWGFAANQWDLIGDAAANNAVNGNKTVSENGTVDLFGWSTPTTYYGISNSKNNDYYSSEFREWGENITGATWKTLNPSDWNYIIKNRADAADKHGQATVNGVNGYIFLPDEWELPTGLSFTAKPNNWTTNVYEGDDWTAMENAGALFLPMSPWRAGNSVTTLTAAYYWTSDYNSSYMAMAYSFQEDASVKFTGINRYAGIPVRLATAGGASATPLDSAQAVKDLIEAIPAEITLDASCVNAIQAARDAYNALTEATKGALDAVTVNKLNQAIADYTALIQAGADEVKAKINNIPQPVTLKLATRDSIESARAAYDALTADQKLLVSNYQTLLDAEAAWEGLINAAPAGALSGKYTINAGGDVIYFAHGNLQYTRENLDADWSTGTFRLATNQYDLIEADPTYPAAYCTDNYGDKTAVGLFGWGTWGEGKTPNLTSSDRTLYTWSTDFSGTLEGTNTWRTLSKDEWVYLLAHNNQSYATVHGVNGLLVAPDGKDIDGKSMADWVVINDETWTTMQNDGYLFLPACGQRSQMSATANITTGDQGEDVVYYSSTQYSDAAAHNIWYKPGQDPAAADYSNKRQAFGVRLVSAGVNPLDQVQVVKGLIDAIPAEITLDAACVNAIEAARAGYDALDNDAKAILDPADVKKLTDAEQALKDLNQAEADKVIAKINNIPLPVELKLATRDSINNARAAYEALNAAQQALVSNYQKLLDAEAALAEKNKGGSASMDIVWDGNTGIADVNPNTTSPAYEGMTVTVGNGSSFSTYQSRLYFTFYSQPNGGYIFANENGTNITKVVIESTTALTSTMTEVDRMGSGWVISNENKTATWIGNADSVSIWEGQSFTNYWVVDKITFTVNGVGATPLDSAQAVKDLIDAIPTPVEYPTSGPAIAAALVAYNQLSDAAKGALDAADVQKMTDAATEYAALDAIAAIENIPAEIVYDPAVKAAIETAREKYDALIDASKALVDAEVVAKLTNAEKAWADLVALIEHNVSYIGKDGELKHETVALLHIPDPAPEFNGYEFVRWDVKAGDFLEEGLRIKAVYTPIITTNPVAYDTLVYNGTAQTLITAGVAKEGHIEYRINDGDWSADLPQATFAAAYVVYYKLVREGHADYIADPIAVTIAKAPVAYTAPTAVDALVYTASNQTLIAAGQTNDGTFEYSLDPTLLDSWKAELPQAKDAGTYSVYYRVKGDLNHLDSVAATPVAVTIAKAALTATADDKNVIYGDAVPAYTVTYAGWQGNDDASVLTGELAFACTYAPTSNVGNYTITPSGVDAANYTITFVNGKVTVAKALLTVTAEDKNVIYGDAVPEYTVTYSGWKNSDGPSVVSGLTLTSEYLVTSNVGTYDIVPANATATNYSFAYVNGTLTVNQAPLMITADDKSVEYGEVAPEFTASYSGWKNSDGPSVVSGLTLTSEYLVTSNVGTYDIVPANATATNYNISFTNGTLTVNQAPLMITAEDKNVIYGDAVPEYTATYSGWKNSDDASVVSNLAYTCEYAPTSNVGEYTITPNSATAQNYNISYTNGKVIVAQATLTVTAEDKTVTYGDAAPAFTATYSGWKNTDDASVVSGLTLTSEYLVTSNVGTYDIVPANATALNYTFVYVNGTLTVNQAALMITADDKSVEYGEVAPAFTASYSGWKNSDGPSVVSGLTLTSEYLVTSNVGTYDIVPANASATNYAISFTIGTLTVNQAPLMITADDKSVIYGDEHPEFTASYSGWKNTDDKSVVSGLTLTSEYLVTSNVGTYDIVPANATATNYAISYTNGTLTVNQAALTITAENKEMIYGDEHPEFTVTYSGWKNTDDKSVVSGLAYTTPYAPGSPIGTYTINPNSATALNYAITFVDGTLTVNKAHVYVSGAEVHTAKFADGHANAEVTNQGVLNGIKLNDPIAHVTTAAFSSADVAEHLTITLFYELTGDDALLKNYNLDPTSEIFSTEGVIIEPFIPNNDHQPGEEEQVEVKEGIDVYAYGYCDGSGYSLKYHLNSGNPDQYKIDFADSRFTDVDWTNLVTTGKDGTIDIDIPVDLPTGDYTMTVYFRDSRFDWLESQQFNVTFHVNLPETFVRPLFDNVIALVDTCNCLTDIQWYWRANSSDPWEPIPGATGYYYHVDGKLTGEYFVKANMNGEPTYTCGQSDMETLYGETQKAQAPVVKAYPNPVVNTTTVAIEYNGSFPEGDKNSLEWNHNLRIVNLMGVEVMNTTFEGNETSVEMSGYPQGNYMISVDGIVVKVMKQ